MRMINECQFWLNIELVTVLGLFDVIVLCAPSKINVSTSWSSTLTSNAHFQGFRLRIISGLNRYFIIVNLNFISWHDFTCRHAVTFISEGPGTDWFAQMISWPMSSCPCFELASPNVLLITLTPWKLEVSVRPTSVHTRSSCTPLCSP